MILDVQNVSQFAARSRNCHEDTGAFSSYQVLSVLFGERMMVLND